jgi:hypothetical protein
MNRIGRKLGHRHNADPEIVLCVVDRNTWPQEPNNAEPPWQAAQVKRYPISHISELKVRRHGSRDVVRLAIELDRMPDVVRVCGHRATKTFAG